MLSVYIIKVDLLIVVGKKNHNNIPKAVKLYFLRIKVLWLLSVSAGHIIDFYCILAGDK